MRQRSPALRAIAFAIALMASVGLGACSPAVDCQAPLTATECADAVRKAQGALDEHPGWIPDDRRPARFTLVWDACQDADCAEDFDGFDFVRLVDAVDERIGHLEVCIDEQVCGDQEVLLGSP